MADAMFLLLVGGSFVTLVGFVRVCERIVRSGAPAPAMTDPGVDHER